MAVDRHELERSKWLLAHAGNNRSMLRRAHKLEALAREHDRAAAGAAHGSHHQAQVPPFYKQWLARSTSFKEKLLRLAILGAGAGAATFMIGPALLVGGALYRLADWQMPKLGPLKSWWFLLMAACLTPVGYLVSMIVQLESFGSFYIYVQLILGTLYTGWLVRAWGWPAVTDRETAKPPRMPRKTTTPKVPLSKSGAKATPTVPTPTEKHAGAVPSVPTVPSVRRPRVPSVPAPARPPVIDDDEINAYVDFDEDEPVFDNQPVESSKEK